jgi:transposase
MATDRHFFPKSQKKGRPLKHTFRKLLNAIFYVVKTGYQWRNVPQDFAPWPSVYHYFRLWKKSELGIHVHAHFRKHVRSIATFEPRLRVAGSHR